VNSLPHPSRLDPTRPDYEAILAAHDRARALGHSTYLDPSTGLVVQTVDTHLRRGACCSSNCRHCPWVQ
jgi:hypothetical protein